MFRLVYLPVEREGKQVSQTLAEIKVYIPNMKYP